MLVRKRVAPNNDCLFASFVFLATQSGKDVKTPKELREYCAEVVKSNPEFFVKGVENEAVLGFDNLEAYEEFITNPFNWGGENEILILAKYYNVGVALASCETASILKYNQHKGIRGIVWLLYTGEHYDPLYIEEEKLKVIPGERDSKSLEKDALAIAMSAVEERKAKLKGKQKQMLQCSGCGELCTDNEEFEKHCDKVEHDDDFIFMCEEVIVNEEGKVVDGIPFQP